MIGTLDLNNDIDTASGVENEPEDPDVAIVRPFDPEHIKVITEPAIVHLIVKRIDEAEIDLAPDFQRRARIWDQGRKSRLIESLLLRIPLPVFYISADAKDRWSVVDGVQRLTTIYDFIKGMFDLRGLEYLTQLEGLTFAQLPRSFQRRIEETSLQVHRIQDGTPEEVMINIFKRINTGGISLTAQEIRNALNKGPARDFLRELALSDEFKVATDHSVSDDRMDAQECVLRFMAFRLTNWDKYATDFAALDLFLNQTMRHLSEIKAEDRERLAADFRRAMTYAAAIFDNDAFRKRYEPDVRRKMVSKALFEAWSVNLAAQSKDELDRLVRQKTRVRSTFMDLMNTDSEFEISISSSTGTPRRVVKRFSAIKELIEKALQ
jgi:Protein of unknown function DUF262